MFVNTGSDAAHLLDVVVRAVVIGVGATVVMDLWAAFLRASFGVASLDLALLGRWVGHVAGGRLTHESIGRSAPIRYERAIGWTAHYAIGVAFAAVLLVAAGVDWMERPTILPPMVVSWVTLVAPFFVMQPAMGAGVAASRTPRPNHARLRSVATHTVYGLGLYASAWIWNIVGR